MLTTQRGSSSLIIVKAGGPLINFAVKGTHTPRLPHLSSRAKRQVTRKVTQTPRTEDAPERKKKEEKKKTMICGWSGILEGDEGVGGRRRFTGWSVRGGHDL